METTVSDTPAHRPFHHALLSVFSASIAVQLIGFARQILIAGYFGVSRGLDIYYVTLSLATMVVFTFGVVFDTLAIPHLVRIRERQGEEAFRKLAGSCFAFSVLFSIVLAAAFVALVPLLARFVTAGFSEAERQEVVAMSWYFAPWALVMLPYYAVGACFKSLRHFRLVFGAEVLMSAVTTLALIAVHSGPHCIPPAFFIGYLSAFVVLLVAARGKFHLLGPLNTTEMRHIYRNFLELVGANQIGSLSSLVERFLQSYLAAGGISALSYSAQLTGNLGSLLGFREIFIVPLAESDGRAQRLERVIIGLSVVAIPIMLFTAAHAETILTLLFKRGRFDAEAVHLTGVTLSVYILCLLPSVIGTPLFRMFQVIDRIRMTAFSYFGSVLTMAALGAFFVFYLRLGVVGLALATVLNSYVSLAVNVALLRYCGLRFPLKRILKYVVYILAGALTALWTVEQIPTITQSAWPQFLMVGFLYCLLVGMACLPIRRQLLGIVYR
jgi:putative peptidoglycan lipid II flippase